MRARVYAAMKIKWRPGRREALLLQRLLWQRLLWPHRRDFPLRRRLLALSRLRRVLLGTSPRDQQLPVHWNLTGALPGDCNLIVVLAGGRAVTRETNLTGCVTP